VIGKAEASELRDYHAKVRSLLAVDDFSSEELARNGAADVAVAAARQNAPSRKKVRKKGETGKKAETA
jgi:hypothetical protein